MLFWTTVHSQTRWGLVLILIFSLRQRILLEPNENAKVTLATAVAYSRAEALSLADKYHDVNVFEREPDSPGRRLRWRCVIWALMPKRPTCFSSWEAVYFLEPFVTSSTACAQLNSLTQSALWQYGISGDLPIVLVRINDARDLSIVSQVLRGHEYLRLKGLVIDLVILNDHPTGYLQELQDELETLVRKSGSYHLVNKPGGIFLRRADIMPEADRILLHTVARVVIVTERGSLSDQLRRPNLRVNFPNRLSLDGHRSLNRNRKHQFRN